jgi:hypothetical protein
LRNYIKIDCEFGSPDDPNIVFFIKTRQIASFELRAYASHKQGVRAIKKQIIDPNNPKLQWMMEVQT